MTRSDTERWSRVSPQAAALKPEDMDGEARTISVRRQVQRERGSVVEIKPPKAGSEREVFVPDRARVAVYDRAYAAFREIYERLKTLYPKLRFTA